MREPGFGHVINAENITDGQFKVFFVGNNKSNAKLGMIVGKRTLPKAVDRNRVKRIIREVFRQHSLKLCKLDMVVMVRRPYIQGCCAQADHLKLLFSRVEIRCAEL